MINCFENGITHNWSIFTFNPYGSSFSISKLELSIREDYYEEIKHPISLDQIMSRFKRVFVSPSKEHHLAEKCQQQQENNKMTVVGASRRERNGLLKTFELDVGIYFYSKNK